MPFDTLARLLARTTAARCIAALTTLAVCSSVALANSVSEVTRIRGQEEIVLRGMGLVVGLNGTGDSTEDLAVARPIAQALRNNGFPVGSVEDMGTARSAALVHVTATIPFQGVRRGDKLTAYISTALSAKSLEGGELYLTPMFGPLVDSDLFAMASGRVRVGDLENPTTARVAGGVRALRDFTTTPSIRGSFELVVEPAYADFGVTSLIATEIDRQYLGGVVSGERIATVIDERTIRVIVPEAERAEPAGFIADVLATDIRGAMRKLPARVICDSKSGAIAISGDVFIAPAVIRHRDLTINTAPPDAADAPAEQRFVGVASEQSNAQQTRLEDLIASLEQIDVTADDLIEIIRMLKEMGHLQAIVEIDGSRL